jgi:LmbE family N-acetylglucosaminyl deacetylase
MLDFSRLRRILVIAPHADDEVLGAGGLMALASRAGAQVNVVFMAVDGLKHWGHEGVTNVDQRVAEIEAVADRVGFEWEIVYKGRDLIEQLDTVSQREMVNYFEDAYNRHRPDVLLLPDFHDFDQDHRATYRAAFAAARPIPQSLNKFFPKNVLTYEIPKIIWSDQAFRPTMYLDISEVIDVKLDGVRLYPTQLREPPHIRSIENVRALAYLRGSEIGVEYAEAYSVLRSQIE